VLLTVVFTDIERSTVMNERLGDQRWLQVLGLHNQIVRERVEAHGGREIKARGDGFMLAFAEAASAVGSSIEIQRELLRTGVTSPDTRVRVRIGMHWGEVLHTGDDLHGRNVTIADRVTGCARGGQILVTGPARREAGDGFTYGPRRTVQLRGVRGNHVVSAVSWKPDAPWRGPQRVGSRRLRPQQAYAAIERVLREQDES
jgi:class 3 adenylate cyclase